MAQLLDTRTRSNVRPIGGRVPPHNLEAEESLLGAMLLSKEAAGSAVDRVSPEDFYKPAHSAIFSAVRALYLRGEPVDAVTVYEEVTRSGAGDFVADASVLVSLQVATPTAGGVESYARIVEEYALLRRMIAAAGQIADLGYEAPADVTAALDQAESLIFEVAERRVIDSLQGIKDLLQGSVNALEEIAANGRSVTGTPTGYRDLDEHLSGLQPSNLVIVGARPSAGKTSFALGAVSHVAIHEAKPVLLFSLEMNHMEITQRLIAAEARIDVTKLRSGRLTNADWSNVWTAIARLETAPIWIDDNPSVTVMDIRAKARRFMATQKGLGLVVVDYMQLMTGRAGAENRQVEVSEISRGLKILARELNVPVLALSQLSRGLEMRSDKRPMLADLRESGSLEQDADVVLFIYRDELYNPESPDRGTAEIMVAKHRNGPIGVVKLAFVERYARFTNYARM